MKTVPFLPENAPFTAEQRAYLNGFFAGLFSTTPATSQAPQPARPAQPLTILFGSQTGNSEGLARRVAKEAARHGFTASIVEMAKYPFEKLASETAVAVITSTFGDGEPPDNAKPFWACLSADNAPKLSQLRFSVCALGDTNYAQFCAFGKAVDEQLEKLGARRVLPRVDCDVDFEEPFKGWVSNLWPAYSNAGQGTQTVSVAVAPVEAAPSPSPQVIAEASAYNRNNPFQAPLVVNRRLNAEGSAKDTRHFGFNLADSSLAYEAGDALGVQPANCPDLVAGVLNALGFDGAETVSGPKSDVRSISPAIRPPGANVEITGFAGGQGLSVKIADVMIGCHAFSRAKPTI